jgi:hypothetical protein
VRRALMVFDVVAGRDLNDRLVFIEAGRLTR